MSIRVLIVDDQNLFAESLRTFIHNYAEDIKVVGIAPEGEAALKMYGDTHPDLVLMDVHMPVMNGVEATKRLLEKNPALKIIMLSTYDKDDYVVQALSYGASGYLLKDLSPTELIASIRAVHSGVSQISPKLVSRLIRNVHTGTLQPEGEKGQDDKAIDRLREEMEWVEKLSLREREVFHHIATGLDNRQIADELCISERTVRNHVSIIYAKLNVENRFQIIQLANRIQYHL